MLCLDKTVFEDFLLFFNVKCVIETVLKCSNKHFFWAFESSASIIERAQAYILK